MKRHPLLAFFIIAFAITWGFGALFFLFSGQLISAFGEPDLGKPFYRAWFHLAVYGAPAAAFIVIAVTHGMAGIRAYLRRLLHWRAGILWYLLVVAGIPAIYATQRIIFTALGGTPPPYPHDPWYMVVPMALFVLIADPGPMEELGWRGFALPLLQQRFSALGASVILGTIWGLWHLPAFFISAAPQSSFAFPVFLLGSIAYSIIMTALYNATGGSIPLAFLFHWQINNAFGLSTIPEGFLISNLLFAAVAVIFIIAFGSRNLGRTKFTEPLPLTTGEN